jgi:hypothetical protein
LSCGAFEQVCAADYFCDLHGCVVNHHGKLIGGDIVATPEKKVGEVAPGDKLLSSEITVVERDRLVVGDFESPAYSCGRIVVSGGPDFFPAGSGIREFVVGCGLD